MVHMCKYPAQTFLTSLKKYSSYRLVTHQNLNTVKLHLLQYRLGEFTLLIYMKQTKERKCLCSCNYRIAVITVLLILLPVQNSKSIFATHQGFALLFSNIPMLLKCLPIFLNSFNRSDSFQLLLFASINIVKKYPYQRTYP